MLFCHLGGMTDWRRLMGGVEMNGTGAERAGPGLEEAPGGTLVASRESAATGMAATVTK